MKNKIIKLAIGLPHAYPWKKEITECKVDDINSVLKKADLDDINKRRAAAWNIEITAYKAMAEADITSKNDLEGYITSSLKDKPYICAEVINGVIKRKRLLNQEEIALYKKFINNTLSTEEKVKNNLTILYWSVDLVMYYKVSQRKSDYSPKELEKDIEKFLSDNFSEAKIPVNKINEAQYKRGYTKANVLSLFSSNFNETDAFKMFLKNFKLEEIKDEAVSEVKSIQDSIMDIFKAANLNSDISEAKAESEKIIESCNDSTAASEEPIKLEPQIIDEGNDIKAVEVEEIKVPNKRLEEHLSGLCEELGYKMAKEDEVILSKEKYNRIMQADEDKEIKILKELVSMKNGAILSELYNTYKNIDSISKDNIEAVLNNFFNTLSLLGCEAENEGNKIGNLVKVNTNNALKDFIFTKAVDCDGEIEGCIEYYGWSYKGRKISPMIIKPNK